MCARVERARVALKQGRRAKSQRFYSHVYIVLPHERPATGLRGPGARPPASAVNGISNTKVKPYLTRHTHRLGRFIIYYTTYFVVYIIDDIAFPRTRDAGTEYPIYT